MPHVDQLPPPEPPKPITITVTPHGDRTPKRDPNAPKRKGVRRPRTQTQTRLVVLGSQPAKRAKDIVTMLYETAMDTSLPMDVRIKAAKEYLPIVMGPAQTPIKGREPKGGSYTQINYAMPSPPPPSAPVADSEPVKMLDSIPANVSLGDAGFSFETVRAARNGTA